MNTIPITLVGGAYREHCAFPVRDVFRGSGGRAAAVLSSLGLPVTFVTYLGPTLRSSFEDIAKKFGYRLDAREGLDDICFRYRYPLGQPSIYPSRPRALVDAVPIEADNALVFGMLEGRPLVHAKRVVYDPQDGAHASHFSSNGSTAQELALVVSYSEGRRLADEKDPEAIALKLLGDSKVSAVVVKCGPQGALVQTQHEKTWVRPFPTTVVYKIGSGDVFSAAFAYAWLAEGRDAIAAAWFASRVVATYVEASSDRIETSLLASYWSDADNARRLVASTSARSLPETQIYLAGPFFTTSQRWLIDEVRDALRDMGFKVFSPVHDVGFGPANEVAPQDLFGLEQSGLMLALLDGLDAGTLYEVGYARSREIPVVAVAESVDANDLTMLLGSGCIVTNDLTTAIYRACWALMGDV